MRRIFLTMLVPLLFSLPISTVKAADDRGNYAIWGMGQKSCFSYSRTRKEGDDSAYRHYLMGYLTAYNMQTEDTYRISADLDIFGILHWLDEYCTERPVHGFDQAVLEFIVEQYPGRYKRVPSPGRR